MGGRENLSARFSLNSKFCNRYVTVLKKHFCAVANMTLHFWSVWNPSLKVRVNELYDIYKNCSLKAYTVFANNSGECRIGYVEHISAVKSNVSRYL